MRSSLEASEQVDESERALEAAFRARAGKTIGGEGFLRGWRGADVLNVGVRRTSASDQNIFLQKIGKKNLFVIRTCFDEAFFSGVSFCGTSFSATHWVC